MNGGPTQETFNKKRVFLVDDHPLVREWLSGMIALYPDLEICGQANEASAALTEITVERPDLVIMDLAMPGSSGLELIKDLRARFPKLRVLVLTAHEEPSFAERALRGGANGYAFKSESGPKIIEAIQTVAAGKFYASPALASQLAARMLVAAQKGGTPEELLSDRELTVFQLRGQRCNTKEIAEILGVSVKTVGSYDARVKEKLGLSSLSELTGEAFLWHNRRVGL